MNGDLRMISIVCSLGMAFLFALKATRAPKLIKASPFPRYTALSELTKILMGIVVLAAWLWATTLAHNPQVWMSAMVSPPFGFIVIQILRIKYFAKLSTEEPEYGRQLATKANRYKSQ